MPDFTVTPIADNGVGAEVTDAVTIDYAMAFQPAPSDVMTPRIAQVIAALQREVYFRWEQRTALSLRLQDLRHVLTRAGVDDQSDLYQSFHDLTSTAEGWMHPGTLSEAAGAHLAALKRRITELEDRLVPVESLGRDAPEEAEQPWRRDDERTHSLILLIDEADTGFAGEDWGAHLDRIARWTDEQCQSVEDYCGACHFKASDNDDVQIPPKPEVLGVAA